LIVNARQHGSGDVRIELTCAPHEGSKAPASHYPKHFSKTWRRKGIHFAIANKRLEIQTNEHAKTNK
jgi:hypothetical protein